ncbi:MULTISPECIES: ABC transporter permease [unclassified Microbacterium]|uniref:ABC transporter permease n=1 Tax=unclassified Microbacterium TaxID=2609290 RepID=UPI0025B379D4|nr:ABC transporter permease [Microbacterium sp. APC 3901]MDN3442793.1 ABC transporter permease [Microbacterium sp. APC 3901]
MGAMAVPATAGLTEVGTRPRLGVYLVETWRLRTFALRLAGSRLIAGLLPNRLGVLWIVLKPLALAIVYGTIFNFILAGAARPANFVPYLIVGVFVFEFFTGCFGSGSKAITSNAKLVQSFGFPRILLPASVIAEQAMRMIPVVVLLGILLLILGEPISWSWLLIVPILAVMGVFNFGVALVVARIAVRTRDIQQLVPIINRVLFYASGIFFNVDGALAEFPTILTIVHLIPTYDFISLARDVLLSGYSAPLLAWIAAPVWALVMLVGGVLYFWQGEPRYGLSD